MKTRLGEETSVAWAVLDLDHPASRHVPLVGAKAANLARARQKGLPVLPGFAVTTAATATLERTGRLDPTAEDAWRDLSEGGIRRLVVRSSGVNEDGAESSMAGLFTSVLDVVGWTAFQAAVAEVVDSAGRVVLLSKDKEARGGQPGIAVLVQPQLDVAIGGVLFGADPVTGRRDRLVVAASTAGPAALVSGEVVGDHHVLTMRGKVVESEGDPLPEGLARRLAALAAKAAHLFQGPQDVEWAVDRDGRLWLLQARPVTAVAGEVEGPVLGPGPIAETLPDELSALEQDLWVPPLRDALRHALSLTGTAAHRRLARSPVVTTVAGRAVADLELLGIEGVRRGFLAAVDPRPPARRLRAAWRVGRLRAALPSLATETVVGTDRRLADVPPLDELSTADLLGLPDRSRDVLVALHGQEVLMGMLSSAHGETPAITAAGRALHLLAAARAAGMSDDEIVHRHPAVLALVAPAIGPGTPALPPVDGLVTSAPPVVDEHDPAVLREALRLRARWIQELMARAAWTIGRRLGADGRFADASDVRLLTLDELRGIARGALLPADLADRRARTQSSRTTVLPNAFRLRSDGSVVAVVRSAGGPAGLGAGGGRGAGPVSHGPGMPPDGSVLVVATLDPGLAAALPRLAGLVAETGSPLSHLAILAREFGVPTVVGVTGARERFAEGVTVVVDGTTGEVERVAEHDATGEGAA